MAVGRERMARAVEIRNHVLPLIRARGELQRMPFGTQCITKTRWLCRPSGETVSESTLRQADADELLRFSLRTPFSNWLTERDRPGSRYAAARARNAAKPVLGYGLDVWHGNKVMSLQ